MRYLLSARVKPGRARDLRLAIEDGSFSRGFPYGDLGKVVLSGRVDDTGRIRWIEVCYCREFYGIAMEEELPFLEEFLTDIVIADARNPKTCPGYPRCGDCDCTRGIRIDGESVDDHLRRLEGEPASEAVGAGHAPRWTGWRGEVSEDEARRSAAAGS